MDWLYQFPFQYTIDTDAIDSGFRSFAVSADVVLSAIRNGLNSLLTLINDVLVFLPWWVYVIAVFFIGFQQSKKITTGAVYAVLLYFIGMVGLWDLMIPTLAIIIAAVT